MRRCELDELNEVEGHDNLCISCYDEITSLSKESIFFGGNDDKSVCDGADDADVADAIPESYDDNDNDGENDDDTAEEQDENNDGQDQGSGSGRQG